MDLFEKAWKNIQKNVGKKENWESAAYAGFGSVAYALIPTAIGSFFKVDMTGWTGVLTGMGSTLLIGSATDKMEIAYGGLGAGLLHIVYVRGNATIQSVLGTPIFAFDPNSQFLADDVNELQAQGYTEVTLPDGSTVMANPQGIAQLNDYFSSIPYAQPQVQTYNTTPEAAGMSDYHAILPGQFPQATYMADTFDETASIMGSMI